MAHGLLKQTTLQRAALCQPKARWNLPFLATGHSDGNESAGGLFEIFPPIRRWLCVSFLALESC